MIYISNSCRFIKSTNCRIAYSFNLLFVNLIFNPFNLDPTIENQFSKEGEIEKETHIKMLRGR